MPTGTVINHIGSTAVDGIWSKPIVDILVEVSEILFDVAVILLNYGWLKMSESETHISFNKSYTENGFSEKVFHLHLRHIGDNDELYFRNYMIHPDIAKEYKTLKLWKKFEHDRDGYTDAKSEFIAQYTALAKKFSI